MAQPSYQHRVVYFQNSRQLQITLDDQFALPIHIPSACTLEGRTITIPLGEGLFDFCYADFIRTQQYAMYNCSDSYLLEPVSVHFEDTLYAALFPDRSRKAASLRALQKEYLNLLLLCCDADYEPEVLGDLTAADRYALWCMINGCSPETVHAEGSTQTCQQLAVASAFHSKLKGNDGDNAWGVYSKYYKRYYARIKRGALTAAAFKQWQEDAARMRDRCLDGKMTLDEYRNWLDRYFQNPSISCPYASHIQCDAVCIGRGKTTTTRIV